MKKRFNNTNYHVFGKWDQWAISLDDGCLRFHPQFNTDPTKVSTHIWEEAWAEVNRLGGYWPTINYLK